jgi:phosphatidylserine decarboxylase
MDEYAITAQRYLPSFIPTSFTKVVCSRMGRSTSRKTRLDFAKTYKVKWRQSRKCSKSKTLEECVDNYATLDEFFARSIDPKLTRPETTRNNALVSPAECFIRREPVSNTFQIKGANYTVTTLLGLKQSPLPPTSTVFIFRLAPANYHRIHSPTSSTVKSIRAIAGNYHSVNPILLDKQPVLQTNYRKIITFENGILMVVIGATCVGTIKLTVKRGSTVKHGDDIGAFGFGGSCIAIFVPHVVEYDKAITVNERPWTPGRWVADF